MKGLDHLDEAAQRLMSGSDEERLRSVRQTRWITYTRARQILDRLEDLLLYPPTHRMPCALVFGCVFRSKWIMDSARSE